MRGPATIVETGVIEVLRETCETAAAMLPNVRRNAGRLCFGHLVPTQEQEDQTLTACVAQFCANVEGLRQTASQGVVARRQPQALRTFSAIVARTNMWRDVTCNIVEALYTNGQGLKAIHSNKSNFWGYQQRRRREGIYSGRKSCQCLDRGHPHRSIRLNHRCEYLVDRSDGGLQSVKSTFQLPTIIRQHLPEIRRGWTQVARRLV